MRENRLRDVETARIVKTEPTGTILYIFRTLKYIL